MFGFKGSFLDILRFKEKRGNVEVSRLKKFNSGGKGCSICIYIN